MRSIFGVFTNGWPRQAGALKRRSSIRMNMKVGRGSSFASSGAAMAPSASRLDNWVRGMNDLFNHYRLWIESQLGIFHVQALQRLDDDLGNGQVAEPLLISRYHIPRRR